MRLNKIIKQALYEEESGTLNVFYSTDIFLRRTDGQIETKKEKKKEAEAEQEGEEETEETPEESTKDLSYHDSLLNEETFRTKTEGQISVPEDDAKTILTLNDLLAYVNRQSDDSGNQIINDMIIEIINSYIDPNMQDQLETLIFKADKINATIDYGFSKEDSVGLQLNKNMGVEDVSLVLRQNGAPASGKFNPEIFKQKIANIFLPELS